MNVVSHELIPPISARYIRITIESWRAIPVMRVEFYGCKSGKIFQYFIYLVYFHSFI